MQVTFLLALVWLLALLGWLAGASAEEKLSENPSSSIVDMWERPVINITAGFPFEGEHPLCSDPLMRLALRIGIKCNPPPPIVFN